MDDLTQLFTHHNARFLGLTFYRDDPEPANTPLRRVGRHRDPRCPRLFVEDTDRCPLSARQHSNGPRIGHT